MQAVAIGITEPRYNAAPPFHPDTHWPELPFAEVSAAPNPLYRLLRDLFLRLGYDAARHGTRDWNPLGEIIRPGQTVVLKPNFVISFHAGGGEIFSTITHPSILRALIDYVYVALAGQGRIIIADAPQMDCDWDELMQLQQLGAIRAFYQTRFQFAIEVIDLRDFAVINRNQPAYSSNRHPLPGDPAGTVMVNLGRQSAFHGLPSHNYYGADYDRAETIRHHHDDVHEYSISRTVLAADVLISIPKMKTHKKVGVTLNLKGFVGINTNKNHLIHYRLGQPRNGGDQMPDSVAPGNQRFIKIQRWLFDHALAKQNRCGDAVYRFIRGGYRLFVRPFRNLEAAGAVLDGGDWYGNDSAWRMAADLAKIVFFADAEGRLHKTPQRKILCVVDGIIGGDNRGPLAPDAKPAGCLVVGQNPVAVDMVTTRLMGFDLAPVRQFEILQSPDWDFGVRSIDEISVLGDTKLNLHFKPHPGWLGHLEARAGQ